MKPLLPLCSLAVLTMITLPVLGDQGPHSLNIYPAIELRWVSKPSIRYQVYRAPDLNGSFVPFGAVLLGDGSEFQIFDSIVDTKRYFYQLRVVD